MSGWTATLLAGLLGSGVTLILAGFGFATLRGKIVNTLEDHTSQLANLRHGLYREDGTLVYVPRTEYDEKQKTCFMLQQKAQDATCVKLEAIKEDLKDIQGKREDEAKEFRDSFLTLNVTLAKIRARQAVCPGADVLHECDKKTN